MQAATALSSRDRSDSKRSGQLVCGKRSESKPVTCGEPTKIGALADGEPTRSETVADDGRVKSGVLVYAERSERPAFGL